MQSSNDPCIYVRRMKNEIFLIAIYVDDIILAGEGDETMNEMKKALSDEFDVEDMGDLHHFLGVKVIQKQFNHEIWIGQNVYTEELLKRFRMDQSRPIETPFDSGSKLKKG